MSELKYQLMLNKDMSWVPCYLKTDADKVIADLEESHKKEVGQLLIEIVELKNKINEAQTELELWRDGSIISEAHQKELDDKLHSDYKRCLAMARWCHNQREIYERDSYNWELNNEAVDSLRNKANIMRKWRKRWLAIAEKFKTNSTAQQVKEEVK